MQFFKTTIRRFVVAMLFGLFTVGQVSAQVDTLHVGEVFKNYRNIKEGKSTYLHFKEMKDGALIPLSIKTHTITNEGKQMKVVQVESSAGQKKTLETWINPQTLETTAHNRTTNGELESFIYSLANVRANPDMESKNNGFTLYLAEPTFNFEIDFEFMKVIPWQDLDTVVLSFYHPGGSSDPAYYTYSVKGNEEFDLANGQTVDTWKIYTDYNAGMDAWFWVSKSTGEVVKHMQDVTTQAGFKFVKLKTYPE